jgi:hypothetical protein
MMLSFRPVLSSAPPSVPLRCTEGWAFIDFVILVEVGIVSTQAREPLANATLTVYNKVTHGQALPPPPGKTVHG